MIRKSSIVAYSILLFPIAYLISVLVRGSIGTFFSYYDELIGCLSMLYISKLVIEKKTSRADNVVYSLLVILTLIGLVSNLYSQVIHNVFPILVDIVFLWKPIACYMAFKNYAVGYRENIVRVLYPWAKFFVVLNFWLSVLGQVVNLGVTQGTFFSGIKMYMFFWKGTYPTAWLIIASLLVIAAKGVTERRFQKYLALSAVPLFLTGASMAWCWLMVELLLILTLRENAVFKKRYIVLLVAILAAALFADISTYLFRETAPRAKLLAGAVRVANMYFPFGSGFATYGSEMASRYYSAIYVAFGWENYWGLGTVYNQFINDNFLACIVGQFGWIGSILYLFTQLNIYNTVNSRLLSRMERIAEISTLLTILATMIGSASAKSAMGAFTFAVMGVVAAKVDRESIQQIQNRNTEK